MKTLAAILLFCASGFAADPIDAWLAAQAKLRAWQADFVQTRTIKTLKQPLRTPGRLAFAAPNRFRWELGVPAQTIAVRDTNEMVVIYPRLKQAERYPLNGSGNEPWRDALALMDAAFAQSRAELEQRFRIVSLTETNALFQINLEPKSPRARRFMTAVKLMVRTNDFAMVANEMRFADGTILRNDFTNTLVNPALPDETFSTAAPADFKVVQPAKP